jgi:hypothetical protein
VSIWDHKVKKRLKQYPKYPGPVAAVAFNCDGSKIAVGVSYTWDEGEKGMKAQDVTPWIGVKRVGDEVKVRVSFIPFPFLLLTDHPFSLMIPFFHSQNQHRDL